MFVSVFLLCLCKLILRTSYRWWLLLILLIPQNIGSTQIQKVATFDLDCKKINLIPNKAFRYYNHIIIDNFLTHSYKGDISLYILLISYTIYFNGRVYFAARCFCSRCFWSSKWNWLQRHLATKKIVIKVHRIWNK